MTQSEKASIFRIISDLIKADSIIDLRELELFDSIKEKYSIKKEDEILSTSLTLSQAIETLKESSKSLKHEIVTDSLKSIMSDDYCAREEALFAISLRACLTLDNIFEAKVLSLDTAGIYIEPNQILYIESEYDKDINREIANNYRGITSEIRLAGFDFVYLPKISEHYKSISQANIVSIATMLYPKVSDNDIDMVSHQLQNLSTAEFCKDQLGRKLKATEFINTPPAIMLKINDSFVDERKISNYLLIELSGDILEHIRLFLDMFAEHHHNQRLCYLKEEKHRFIYTGFYKQIFDLYLEHNGIKSSILIDTRRGVISLPEAGITLSKLHRREKALYTLLILESASGGINFTKPNTEKKLEKYRKRILSIQQKYNIIYKRFGGEETNAPDIEKDKIRLPMISLIKKELTKYQDQLFNIDDYIIQRNIYGNYCINLDRTKCLCCERDPNNITCIWDSSEWQRIIAL